MIVFNPNIVTGDTIIGRARELEVIASFVNRDVTGAHGLLIEGEAGMGKTTLWRAAVRSAEQSGLVLASRPSEAEARMSFTVLGDLLGPLLDDDLLALPPVGQRRALEAALLLSVPEAVHPDQRAVSLATLTMLRGLARTGSVTIALDDVQWVDRSSVRALAFALRRLDAEPVRVVVARRLEPTATEPLDLARTLRGRLERVALGPLDEMSLSRVLHSSLGRGFPRPLVTRIHEQTGGNPLFAVEVGRALGVAPASLRPGEPLPVPRDLEELLLGRLSRLSRAARDSLVAIAASPTPTHDVVEAAGATRAGIREASDAGIVATRGQKLEFTHPLLASTVYGCASARERRRVHALLANVASDPEEHARHLALAADGPSEEVATALDAAAMKARDRGAPLAAAELLKLAADLTPVCSNREVDRLRDAAVNLFDAGDGDSARKLLEQLLERLGPGVERSRTLFNLSFMSWSDLDRVAALLSEALDHGGENPDLRARILADTAWAEFYACRPAAAAELARAALEIAELLPDPFPRRHSLSALASAEAVLGRSSRDLIGRAVALEVSPVPGESTGPSIILGRLLLWDGEVESARAVLEEAHSRFVDQGRDAGTWEILGTLAEVELRAGRWDRAATHASAALEIAGDAGRSNEVAEILATRATISTVKGHVEDARRVGLTALSLSERNGDRWSELAARSALGLLELSLGSTTTAYAFLEPAVAISDAMELAEPGARPFVGDAVEALVRLGELDEAERLTDRLEQQGRTLDRALALATAARCRGLIAGARRDPAVAADHLDRALAEHGRVEHPFELARTLLVAGEVQRRMKRKRPARLLLEQARDTFDALGAPMWVTRARAELARVGGRPPSPGGLTPTETEVARLVAQGLTNREVADTLFMSPSTVKANLARIYGKVGVRSRTELAAQFDSDANGRSTLSGQT